MAGFSNASTFIKIALGFCIAAVLFDVIGFPTPYWISNVIFNSGLFKECETDELKATTAMVIIGFLVGLVCLVLTICHLFVEPLGTKIIKTVCMILAFVAALFTLVGVIIYGVKYDTNLGWSFALVIIGGLLYIATGVMFVIDTVKG
ncbi:uncharacterized protein LOC121370121 [Gigantopelta aegis]|uniref:uncharacterized protein LOC121370121 n=1 Tax=Gigantopelta aegis TaxID=1735272 RepID=UPI001B889DA2|nr:uncharacterized protein LOC121370121 [Gigantopelta aegis]